eukprot:1283103-Amorphochlora_amoeboformis.AAC.1
MASLSFKSTWGLRKAVVQALRLNLRVQLLKSSVMNEGGLLLNEFSVCVLGDIVSCPGVQYIV